MAYCNCCFCLFVGMTATKLQGGGNPVSQSGGIPNVKNEQSIQQTKSEITEAEAKKIALDKAGLTENDVIFERTEKDYENGILVYEIEFRKGRTEYKAEISVSDGKIISWEIDND